MKRGVSSASANIALAVGVSFALAVAAGFTLRHQAIPSAPPPESATKGIVYLRLPPARRPVPPIPVAPTPRGPPAPAKESAPLVMPISAPVPPVPPKPSELRTGTIEEPFEPPAPPMVAMAPPAPVPRLPAGTQVAALPPSDPAPSVPAAPITRIVAAPVPSAAAPPARTKPATPTEPAISVKVGDPVPPLRTVPLTSHEVHAVPDHEVAVHPVTVVTHAQPAPPVVRAAPRPKVETASRETRIRLTERVPGKSAPSPASTPSGPSASGLAIVTAALELNVDGKPLKLAGVKLPVSTDMCAPNPAYAARSCADVTREALAARVGSDARVSCRILAGGRGPWPALCKNRDGVDLGAYLIEHGFALADDSEIADYSAAETRARTAHSGLWSYR